jgi:hypothetical protein
MKKQNTKQGSSNKIQKKSTKTSSKHNTSREKTSHIPILWHVKGANWQWDKKGTSNQCPMEIATQALEDVWSKDPNMQGIIKKRYLAKNQDTPILGFTMLVSHSGMKSKGDHFLICSVTALANAGFYCEANELQQLA